MTLTAKVMTKDPYYVTGDGALCLMDGAFEWDEIRYVEPHECCCREDHNKTSDCMSEDCCGMMCDNCRDDWAIEHEVIDPCPAETTAATTHIDTTPFERSHTRKPGGLGIWWFTNDATREEVSRYGLYADIASALPAGTWKVLP